MSALSIRSTRVYNIYWEEGEEHFVQAMYDWAKHDFGADQIPPREEWDLSDAVIWATQLCDGGDLDKAVSIEDEDFEVLDA